MFIVKCQKNHENSVGVECFGVRPITNPQSAMINLHFTPPELQKNKKIHDYKHPTPNGVETTSLQLVPMRRSGIGLPTNN